MELPIMPELNFPGYKKIEIASFRDEVCLPKAEYPGMDQLMKNAKVRFTRETPREFCFIPAEIAMKGLNKGIIRLGVGLIAFFGLFAILGDVIFGAELIGNTIVFAILAAIFAFLFSVTISINRIPLPIGAIGWIIALVMFGSFEGYLLSSAGLPTSGLTDPQAVFAYMVTVLIFILSLLGMLRGSIKKLFR
jgi:hypothetical protein